MRNKHIALCGRSRGLEAFSWILQPVSATCYMPSRRVYEYALSGVGPFDLFVESTGNGHLSFMNILPDPDLRVTLWRRSSSKSF